MAPSVRHLRGQQLLGLAHGLDRSQLQNEFEFLSDGTRGFIVDVAHLDGSHEIALGDAVLARS